MQHGDELAILAARTMLRLCTLYDGGDVGASAVVAPRPVSAKGYLGRVEVACLLEAAMSCSPYNHHLKVCGSVGAAGVRACESCVLSLRRCFSSFCIVFYTLVQKAAQYLFVGLYSLATFVSEGLVLSRLQVRLLPFEALRRG